MRIARPSRKMANDDTRKERNQRKSKRLISASIAILMLFLVLTIIYISASILERHNDINPDKIELSNQPKTTIDGLAADTIDDSTADTRSGISDVNESDRILVEQRDSATKDMDNIKQISKRQNIHADGIVTNIWLDGESHLDKLKDRGIKYLFVDIGGTDRYGKIDTPEDEIAAFIELVRRYEAKNDYDFILLAYSEINTNNYQLTDPFLDNMAKDYTDLVKKGFNGTLVDIEPVKLGQRVMYIEFLNSLREQFPIGALITVYAGNVQAKDDLDKTNEFMWSYDLYRQTSEIADIIVVQGYDEGFENKEEYQDYIRQQKEIINGYEWQCDFMLGVPTHNPFPETIQNCLESYRNDDNLNPRSNFIGVSIFAEWTIKSEDWQTYDYLRYVK